LKSKDFARRFMAPRPGLVGVAVRE
jgi:hypothetical protein